MINLIRYILGYFIGITIFILLIPYGLYELSKTNMIFNIDLTNYLIIRILIALPFFTIGLFFIIWSNISLFKIGSSKELGFSYTVYALLCMGIPLKKRSNNYHQKAIKKCKELNYYPGLVQALECYGTYFIWNESNYIKAIEMTDK